MEATTFFIDFWKNTPPIEDSNTENENKHQHLSSFIGCEKHRLQTKANIQQGFRMRAAESGSTLCVYSGSGSGSRNETGISSNVLLIVGIAIAVLVVLAVVLFLMTGGLKRKSHKGHDGAKKSKSHSKHSKHSKNSRKKTSSIKKHNTSRGGGHSIGNKSKTGKLKSSKHSAKKSRISQSKKVHSQKHF